MPGLPGIGFFELLVVLAIALVALGPERLPQAARTLGRWMAELRRTADDLRTGIEREVRLDEIRKAAREIGDEVGEAVSLEPKRGGEDPRRERGEAQLPGPAPAADPANEAGGGSPAEGEPLPTGLADVEDPADLTDPSRPAPG